MEQDAMRAILPMRTMRTALSFVLLCLAAGCTEKGSGAPALQASAGDVPDVVWNIRGTVTRVGPADGRFLGSALVEQPPMISSGAPRDVVNVTRSTKILRQTTDGLVHASIADLRVGTVVKAWYTAYVAPPFPRQVEARVILILK